MVQVDERDEELARQAADPSTPLVVLQLLARDHPELRATLAANPSTYPALLEWLGALGMPDVDAALRARADAEATREEPAEPASDEPAGTAADTAVLTTGRAATRDEHPTVVRPVAWPTAPSREDAAPAHGPTDDAGPAPFDRALAAEVAAAETARAEAPTVAHPPVILPPATPAEHVPADAAPPSRLPAWRPATAAGAPGPAAAERPTTPTKPTKPTKPTIRPLVGDRRRRRAVLGAGGGLVLVLVVALVWMLTSRGGQDPAPQASTPSSETTTTASPTSAPPTADPAGAQAALAGLPASSACTDPAADARVFTAFAVAAAPDGTWTVAGADQTVLTALTGLQTTCGPAHAVQVNNALLAGAQTPPALATSLRDAPAWVQAVRAAPADAQDLTDFTSPSGNIACVLGGDATTCTIDERSFPNPPQCVAGPVTLVVPLGGDARVDCAAPAASSAAVLGYGTSTTANYFACVSERDGVTCWSTLTGRGFSVARADFTVF